MEPREAIAAGDEHLCNDEPRLAVHAYADAARSYAQQGLQLKAIALWKQSRTVIASRAPRETSLAAEARTALIQAYRALGLEMDARAIEAER